MLTQTFKKHASVAGTKGADSPSAAAQSAGPDIRRLTAVGAAAAALFFGGFLGWASLAQLESAAIAPGTVSLDSSRKMVQHLEGGIVKRIMAREGEAVTAGQPLIYLDNTQIRARLDFLQAQIVADRTQLRLVKEEVATVAKLLEKGLTQKPRLLALQRRQAEITGSLSRYRAQLRAARDVEARTVIRAPLAGLVVGLQVHSPEGVIAKGEPLMYIVPQDELLIVEAQVHPSDIDSVHAGLEAHVRLTAFNARSVAPIAGRVLSVSADVMTDQRTGEPYYLARIRLDDEALEALDGKPLYPGMPAEVMIVVGERTPLDYFLSPLTTSFNRAFRES